MVKDEEDQRGLRKLFKMPQKPGVAPLRTSVPTFVSAHMFCASRMVQAPCTGWADTDPIKYAIKYTTKLKANFFYGDQIKFNVPVLKLGTSE